MKNFNLLSKMCSPLVGSQSNDVSFDCRLTVGSPSGLDAKWKQNPFMRFAVVLTLIFTIGSGNAWGADITWTWTASSGALGTTSPYAASLTGTTSPSTPTDNTKAWTVTRDAVLNTGWNSSCVQLGKKSNSETVTLTSSAFSGTIKSVYIECSSASGKHTVSVSVGGTSYLSETATSSWTTVSSKGGTGSSSGTITITLKKGTGACYVKSITVTYAPSSTGPFTVTYDGNGKTGGSVPVDAVEHAKNSSVSVLGNTGSLVKTGYTFNGWNTMADGSGTAYAVGSSIASITQDMTLYAQWKSNAADKVFYLVEDVSDLSVGQNIVIVSYYSSAYYAMSTEQRTSNRGQVAAGATEFTMSNSNKTLSTASTTHVEMLTLTSTDAGYFGFQTLEGKYLYASSSSANELKSQASVDNNAKWKVTLNTGVFSIQADKSANRNHLRFNGGNSPKIFSCYESATQTAVLIYAAPTCAPLGTINGSVKVISGTSATLQWDVLSGVDGTTPYSVSVSPSEGTSVGGISTVDGRKNCTISGLTAGTEYTFTINAFGDGSHCDKSQDIVATTPKITLGSASGTSTYIEGSGPGSKQTFTVNAVGLTGDLTVTAPTNFEVCDTENGTYASSKTLTATSGAVSTTVYFRLVTGKTAASSPYAGSVTVSGGSATSQTVAVNGTVSQACHTPTISGQPAVSASYNMNVTATALSVTAAKGDVSDPTLTYQWYSNTANSKTTPEPSPIDGATSSSYTPPTTTTGTKYYFCEVSSGACSLTSSISAITVNTPSLTVSETARAFGDREVNAGPYTMTFTVSGSNLAKDAPITISGASGMFSVDKTSVSQTSTGAVSTTTITVTYNPTTTATHNATLTIASTGATSKTVTLSGTGKNAATVKIEIAGSESTISGTRYEGDSYTLPSTAADCPEMGFYGWYKGTYSHATTAPTGANFYLPGATATLTAGENKFYAVYATITPDAANTYTKITTTGELVTGDYLLVAYFSASYIEAMKNTVNASDYMDEVNVKNYVNNTTTPTKVTLESDNSAIRWRITKSTSTITIYNAAVSKYFCGSTGTPALNTTSEDFSYSVTSGNWTLVTNSKTVYYSNQWYVGTPSSAKPIYLFKRDPSVSGPYTTSPSCTTHSLSTAVTPVSTGTAVAGKTVIGEGKTTTVTATPESGYAFRYWTISGEGSTMSNTSDGKSTDNPVTVTMGTADATITAHFAERVAITFNVPTGVTKPSNSYTDVALPTPDGLPTGIDDDCWAFAGWTESSSVNNTSAPATLYPAGSIYSGSQESAFNLYAVYSRNKYLVVYDNDMLEADADYVISTWDGDSYAVVGIADDNDAEVADMADYFHDKVLKGLHYYTLDNPTENAVWHLTGTSGSYVLQNKATGKYLDVAGSSLISGSSATLAITEGTGEDAQTYKVTGGDNHLVISSSGASVATGDAEYYFLYKMISSKYMTTPAEPTYAVTYKVSGQSDVVKNVNACTGITASDIPDAPDDDAIGDCADTFMGWSATDLGSADDQDAPDDLFTTYTNAPYLTGDLTLYAVFATAGSGGSTTHTLTKDNTSWSGYTTGTQDDDQGETWSYYAAGQNQSGTYYWSLNSNALNYNIGSPSFSGNVTSLKAYVYNASSKDTKTIYVCSSNETAQPTSGDLGSYVVPASENGEITITISGTFNQFYIYTSAALYIKYITVTYSSVSYSDYKTSCSCNGNPTVTSSASLKGTFSLSEVGVTVADLSVGTGCEWTDAGFVWSPSTNTTPTVGGTNCTKVQVLTSGTDATFDGTLEGEFEVDATYYYRAYGKNEYESGSYQYSTSVSSFIPRSVTFNSNGGSSVATKYVPNGTPVTAPDDPTKTGYDFSKWQLSGADYNFSSNVTASITLDAVWTAQSYSITYKDQGGGDYSGNKTAGRPTGLPGTHTYGSATDVSTDGSKSGYTFGGWYLEEDCSGDEVTSLGATSFDEDITLYAKWTAKKNYFVDRMHGNCDGVNTVNIGGIVYNCYLREGAGYTVPDLSDNDTGSNSCVSGHAHFIGWVVAGKIGAQGQLVSGYTVIKGGTVQTAGTDGTIYYAVWAEE